MKITIRNSIWETNSSSMHSIAVMKNKGQYTHDEMIEDMCIYKGRWELIYGDGLYFDRHPFNILASFSDKCRYAIAAFAGSYRSYKQGAQFIAETLLPIITKYIPECWDIRFKESTKPVFNDQEGNELDMDEVRYHVFELEDGSQEGCEAYERDGTWYRAVETDADWTYADFGAIDHQSMWLLEKFLEKEKITLEEFLVNRQYIVIIDGDEYGDWDRYKTIGIINTTGIDHEYPPIDDDYGQMPMDSYIYFEGKKHENNN